MTDHEGVEAEIAELPDEQKDQVRAAVRGLDIEAELSGSVVIKLIRERADDELRAARRALESVDPADAMAIKRLQNQCWRARSIEVWIRETIEAGRTARIALEETEST